MVQSRVLIHIFSWEWRVRGCPFEVLGHAVPGCILSVEIHAQAFPCWPPFGTSQSPLGNMLIDLAHLASEVLPHSVLEPQCFSDKTKWQLPLEDITGREMDLKVSHERQGSRTRLIAWNLGLKCGSHSPGEEDWEKASLDCCLRLWQIQSNVPTVLADTLGQVSQHSAVSLQCPLYHHGI